MQDIWDIIYICDIFKISIKSSKLEEKIRFGLDNQETEIVSLHLAPDDYKYDYYPYEYYDVVPDDIDYESYNCNSSS